MQAGKNTHTHTLQTSHTLAPDNRLCSKQMMELVNVHLTTSLMSRSVDRITNLRHHNEFMIKKTNNVKCVEMCVYAIEMNTHSVGLLFVELSGITLM